MMPIIPSKTNEKESFTCVNNFIAKLSQKIITCSSDTVKIACNLMAAILDKDKKLLQKYCEEGLPDDLPMLRAYIWKIILNYLPEDPEMWEQTLKAKREQYNLYKSFIKIKLQNEFKEKTYKSKEILEQIIKDVYRTNAQIAFFFEPTDKTRVKTEEECVKMLERRKTCTFKSVEEIYYDETENEIHVDVLKRILFIYSIICPDISYHQGMNELLAPIYYIYSYDKEFTEETEENIEADSFWSFHYLMSKISQSFVSPNDQGLAIKAFIFEKCLDYVDDEITNSLRRLNIMSEFYCYKWFILLYSQEFEINDLFKLWDLILSQEDKYYYTIYIGMAILIMKKNTIVNGQMYEVMNTLQNFSDINIIDLIKKTREINIENKEGLDLFILKTKKISQDFS